ncbi:MAG: hypothetical protein GEV13_26135 [Rhodospirillales bacterium]|nr:hypothetical protein [Rhodospirillales bacterium]
MQENNDDPHDPGEPRPDRRGRRGPHPAKGYSGVKSLTRDPAGKWAAKAMRNDVEVAVIVEPSGAVREQ